MKTTMKLLAVFALIGISISVNAQNYTNHEVANAPAFTSIDVRGGDVNVLFTQGETHSFSINGPEKLVKRTKIKINNNTIYVNYNEPFFSKGGDVNVYVSAPQLNNITVAGKADFKVQTNLQGKELNINTFSNGEVSIRNLYADTININASGDSDIDLKFLTANTINVKSLGTSDVELSGTTNLFNVIDKGTLAEIDTEHLIITNTKGNGVNSSLQKVTSDGGVEYSF